MNRLTKDDVKEMGMLDLSHNQVFVKNREAWYRDFEREVSARDLVKEIFECNKIEYPADNEEFDEYMLELLQDGCNTLEGLVAMLYNALWAFADVREILKAYEDTELTPEEFIDLKVCLEDEGDVGGTIRDLIELMQYRKLEAEGRLIKLPCPMGTKIFATKLTTIFIGILEKKEIYSVEEIFLNEDNLLAVINAWNKTVFLTQEEAENALKEENNA